MTNFLEKLFSEHEMKVRAHLGDVRSSLGCNTALLLIAIVLMSLTLWRSW